MQGIVWSPWVSAAFQMLPGLWTPPRPTDHGGDNCHALKGRDRVIGWSSKWDEFRIFWSNFEIWVMEGETYYGSTHSVCRSTSISNPTFSTSRLWSSAKSQEYSTYRKCTVSTDGYNQVQPPSDDDFDLSPRRQHDTSIARLRKSHWSCTTVICIPHVMTTLASGHRASTTVVGSIQGHQICWAFAFRTGRKVHGRRCLMLADKGEPCLVWKESQTPAVRRPNSIEFEVAKACCVIYMRYYIDYVLS